MDRSGLLVDYCDVFISCLDSHSDGTHWLQRIHCWVSNAMPHFSKSNEETNSSTSWITWGWRRFQQMKSYDCSHNISFQDSDTKLLLFGRAINASVKLDPLDVVGKKFKVENYLDDKHPPRDFYVLIKPEIEEIMTKTITFDILFNNSEHQATMLRYGVKKSEQVKHSVHTICI